MKECNISFLIAALVFLLLQFYHFMLQRRLDDIKNRVFRFFFLIGIGDILLDLICTLLIAQEKAEYAPVVRVLITIFYLAQVLVPYAFAGYVIALREELPHINPVGHTGADHVACGDLQPIAWAAVHDR